MKRRSRWFEVLCISVSGALLLGACSSSEADSTDSIYAGPSGPPLTGAPVVFGLITDASGSTGQNPSAEETAKRWVAYTNNHGGINGHPVEVIVKDTKNTAATALQAAKELVEQDHAVAIGDDTYVNFSFAKYAAEKHIPVISLGKGFVTFTYVSNPNFFSPTANAFVALWGQTKAAALKDRHKFSILYCAEIASCAEIAPIIKGHVESLGGTMPYTASFSASAPDYTALCLGAKDAGVDALLAGGSVAASNKRVYEDCARQGYTPLAVLGVSAVTPELLSDRLIPLSVSVIGVQPWFERKGPTYDAFHTVMDEYLKKPSSKPMLAVNQWVGLEMFKKAGAAPASTAVTTAVIYKGLYSMKNETLGGAVTPFTITKGKPGTANCLYAYQSDRGRLSTLNNGQPVCKPAG